MNSEKPETTTSESRSQANKLYSKKLKIRLRNSENKQFCEKRMRKTANQENWTRNPRQQACKSMPKQTSKIVGSTKNIC